MFSNGDEINLFELEAEVVVQGFAVTADEDCTLQFKVLNDTQTISLKKGHESVVTIGDLILGEELPIDVDLGILRSLYTSKKVNGQLLIDGKSVGTLSVTLKFKIAP